MVGTRVVITVDCKVPLSDADLRWLELDAARRLQTALVQKFASIEFTVLHGTDVKSPNGLIPQFLAGSEYGRQTTSDAQ